MISLIVLVLGAALIGACIPEWLFVLGVSSTGKVSKIPTPMNVYAALGMAMIAYGAATV